ncbi:MAG: porin [Candidatus Brocadiaceae bacterium]|jgi:phosphate-selective porin OprO/OprP
MSKLLRNFLILAVTVPFVATGVARAQFTQEEVLRRRIDKMEKELSELRRALQRRQPARGVDREQVSAIVKEELEKAQGPETMKVYWDKGLRLKTMDEAFKLKIGGRIMADWAWMSADDEIEDSLGELDGDAEFRRARFYMSGDIYDVVGYKLQIDFASGGDETDIKDAYLSFKKLVPGATLKVGHFKEPFSLEELTSSKYITFMERALPVGAFSPSRNMGFQVSDHVMDDRATWAAGVFWDYDSKDDEATYQEGVNLTGRLTYLPYYEDDGEKLVHLGVAGSYRSSPDRVRFRTRPEVHLADNRWAETSSFEADDVWLGGLEAALVHGPFSVQGEYIMASADSEAMCDPTLDGFYVFASYFLTGEHRPYKTSSGSFSRVKPNTNFDGKGGWGAWELAARYSNVDLNDADITDAGELDNVTLGLNWYLNPNMRVMWNYVHASLDEADLGDGGDSGDGNAFMMRFQVDF